jgi:hypothetical protein
MGAALSHLTNLTLIRQNSGVSARGVRDWFRGMQP